MNGSWEAARQTAYRQGRVRIDAPAQVENLELTTRCNARCAYCPRPAQTRDLPSEIADRLLEEADLDFDGTWLHLRGEPLLAQQLVDSTARIHARGGRPRLSTNGLLLDAGLAERLSEAGLAQIVFSLDAVQRDTYARIHGHERLREAERGVLTMLEVRDRLGAGLEVQAQMLRCRENEAEWRPFVVRWLAAGADSVHLKPLYTRAGALPPRRPDPYYLRADAREWAACYHLWRGLVVRADGSVGVCCSDFSDLITVGNLRGSRLASLWNGTQIRALRQAHLEGTPPMPCRGCPERVTPGTLPGGPALHLYAPPEPGWLPPAQRSVYLLNSTGTRRGQR